MSQRGRPSAAALELASSARIVSLVERQPPPPDLSEEEAKVWVAIVNCEPADKFSPSTAPLLAEYCRHVIHARRIAALLEQAVQDPELSIKDYDRLLKMQDRESRAISSLATKMRISQQATTNHRGNRKASGRRKPWEG